MATPLGIIHLTAAYTNAVMVVVLPHVSDIAKQLDLPISTPITTNEVARFAPPFETNQFEVAVWLTNGYWFGFTYGNMASFRSPDSWYSLQDFDMDRAKDFVGKDNMTTNEAIDLARRSFVNLGYKLADFDMDPPPMKFEGPYNINIGHIPFCRAVWQSPYGETNKFKYHFIQFDIDLCQKRISGMALVGRKLERPPPDIGMVPELEADYRKRMHMPPMILDHD